MVGSGCRTLAVLLAAVQPTVGIRVVDVPTFGLQCKLTTPSLPTAVTAPPEPDAVFFFGDRDDMNTLDKNRGESASSGDWSAPQLNVTTELINRTAHVGPPHTPQPTHSNHHDGKGNREAPTPAPGARGNPLHTTHKLPPTPHGTHSS